MRADRPRFAASPSAGRRGRRRRRAGRAPSSRGSTPAAFGAGVRRREEPPHPPLARLALGEAPLDPADPDHPPSERGEGGEDDARDDEADQAHVGECLVGVAERHRDHEHSGASGKPNRRRAEPGRARRGGRRERVQRVGTGRDRRLRREHGSRQASLPVGERSALHHLCRRRGPPRRCRGRFELVGGPPGGAPPERDARGAGRRTSGASGPGTGRALSGLKARARPSRPIAEVAWCSAGEVAPKLEVEDAVDDDEADCRRGDEAEHEPARRGISAAPAGVADPADRLDQRRADSSTFLRR